MDPKLKPTTLIKQMLADRHYPEEDVTIIRRLQTKWKAKKAGLLAAAQNRAEAAQAVARAPQKQGQPYQVVPAIFKAAKRAAEFQKQLDEAIKPFYPSIAAATVAVGKFQMQAVTALKAAGILESDNMGGLLKLMRDMGRIQAALPKLDPKSFGY